MCVFLGRTMKFFGTSLGGGRSPPPPVDPPLSLKALLDTESVRPPAMTPGWFLSFSGHTTTLRCYSAAPELYRESGAKFLVRSLVIPTSSVVFAFSPWLFISSFLIVYSDGALLCPQCAASGHE